MKRRVRRGRVKLRGRRRRRRRRKKAGIEDETRKEIEENTRPFERLPLGPLQLTETPMLMQR